MNVNKDLIPKNCAQQHVNDLHLYKSFTQGVSLKQRYGDYMQL